MIELITDISFEEKVFNHQGVLLLQYFTEWSGASIMMQENLKSISSFYKEKITVYKIDYDENTRYYHDFNIGIWDLPIHLFFLDGQLVERIEGLRSFDYIKSKIDNILFRITKTEI